MFGVSCRKREVAGSAWGYESSRWYFLESREYTVSKTLAIIRDLGVHEVYVPVHNMSNNDFFGNKLGYQNLTDELNDKGEIECWFEIGAFNFCWEMISLLKECQIKVLEIDPDTMEVVDKKE